MDNRYFDNVIAEIEPLLLENGLKKSGEGSFISETKSFTVAYNDDKQMYTLSVADVLEDGELTEPKEINAWLFDDSQNANDAVAVGIDFLTSIRKELGIKVARKVNQQIDLPTATKSGNITVSGFSKKMLDIFPPLKEKYKEHVATYGEFLYVNFFGENLVPALKEYINSANKKQLKKLYDVIQDAYIKGDRATVNIIVALLCAVSYNDEKTTAIIKEMLAENEHFMSSYTNFIPVFPKNKALFNALIK